MLSVVIETHDDEGRLARTLSSLVPAAVEGVVRDVVVADRGSSDLTHRVADTAGCVFVTGGDAATAIRKARGDWLLFLEPGSRLMDGWMEAVTMHTETGTAPARFARSRDARLPLLARVLMSERPLACGLVITKRQAKVLAQPGINLQALARGLAACRINAHIVPASTARRNR